MRLLRWGIERCTVDDEMVSQSGLVVLRALLSAQLLQREDEIFVERVVADVARLRLRSTLRMPSWNWQEETMAEQRNLRERVTRRQVMAAQLAVDIAKKHGREPDPRLVEIANAVPVDSASESTAASRTD